jgi:hypothetical protein
MLAVEPKSLSFQDVRLNQAYTASLCITNPLSISVDFSLRPSSSRYTITPNKVNLSAGQSIVVSVRLFLSHYPNYTKGVRGQDDTIHIKSSYFDQQVDVSFFLHSRDTSTKAAATRSRSPSPARASEPYESILELQAQLKAKDLKIKQMEDIIGQLESKYPSLQDIVRNRLEQERAIFEEKSEKVTIALCGVPRMTSRALYICISVRLCGIVFSQV